MSITLHTQPTACGIIADHLGPGRRPALLRGDKSWGIERVMARAEQNDLAYLFRLRMTVNVTRSLDRAMAQSDWADAGQGWQGKETTLRLQGWSRQRRVILLRRKLARDLAITEQTNPAQPRLIFAEIGPDKAVWEYAALVTSLDSEILTLGQLYRDRADCENVFDELKNQWGWGGFTTQDLTRCRLLAGMVALIYNWWSLFGRLADPEHHREAITSRPLLLSAIARKTQHAGQVTLTISSTHGLRDKAREAYVRIAGFLASCGKMRSSWTRWKNGVASSAKPSATSCTDDNFSRHCVSPQHEPTVAKPLPSSAAGSAYCRI